MKQLVKDLFILVSAAIFLSCTVPSKDNTDNKNDNIKTKVSTISTNTTENASTFTDERDGKTYKTVKIGNQIWLAENFAYKPETSKYGGFDGNYWAYNEKEANIEKYGYLYDWETANKIVPKGWHLPTKEEFETLLNHYGGDEPFKALTEDKNGLNIIYNGWYYQESMAFSHENNETGFWSATKNNDKEAWLCIIQREWKNVFIRTRFMVGVGAAVRLVKDNSSSNTEQESKGDAIPKYVKIQDESPKTTTNGFKDFVNDYNEIIKGEGYTVENPEVNRNFTTVTLKKKNGEVKMIEIAESDRNYENKFQYFYKDGKLFYSYIMLSYSDGEDEEGMLVFTTEKRKVYFKDDKCIMFLFSNSDKNEKYPDYESKGEDILKEGKEHLQRTKTKKWNEF